MFSKPIAAGVAFALSLGLTLWFLSPAWMTEATAAPKPADTDERDFKGKVIVIQFAYPYGFSPEPLALEGAKIRKLGDKFFLTGKAVAVQGKDKDAVQDKTVWQSLGEISQIIECESVETAKKTLKALPAAGRGLPTYPSPVLPQGEPTIPKQQ